MLFRSFLIELLYGALATPFSVMIAVTRLDGVTSKRSEERRVGKEGRSRGAPDH